MKPATKYQKMVSRVCNELRPLTSYQKKRIIETYPDRTAIIKKRQKKAICTCCGHNFDYKDDNKEHVKCPQCGKTLKKIYRTRPDNKITGYYYTLIDAYKDSQVTRTFLVEKYQQGEEKPYYFFGEATQNWQNPNYKTIIARPIAFMTYDKWLFGKEMTIKKPSYYNENKYYISGYDIPGNKATKESKRRGLKVRLIKNLMQKTRRSQAEIIENFYKNHIFEYLLKTGQTELFEYFMSNNKSDYTDYENVLKICKRHKYKITNPGLYIDYIDLLKKNDKDIHSPHYICPDSLSEAHKHVIKIDEKRRKKALEEERKRKLQEDIEKSKQYEKLYQERIKYFRDMDITDGNIHIKVIPTVKDVAEEGASMHHCIFECKYYEKKDTLLMSARNNEGERVETIEYDLKKMAVKQSRGKCNSKTPMHNLIINLIKQNKSEIKKIKQIKRHKKKIAL